MKPRYSWLLPLFLVLALMGCKEQEITQDAEAQFTYSPETVIEGQTVTFDASASQGSKKSSGQAQVTGFDWNFGDGSTATGAQVTHVFDHPGVYQVVLDIEDAHGERASRTRSITVDPVPHDAVSVDLQVLVSGIDGALLTGATVSVGNDTAQTGQTGVAELTANLVAGAEFLVVKAELEGFIGQAIRVELDDLDNLSQLLLTLRPVQDSFNLSAIENAQTVMASTMGATVRFPQNAFVNPDGSTATGAARIELTPWDISDLDLLAMPANGLALDLNGDLVNLISAGMMTVNIYNAAGERLQLLDGVTATIEMDLPFDSIDGMPMTPGTEIPMWYFDEQQGLWLEEDLKGVVVEDQSGQLRVTAQVPHFSTWNWDYVFTDSGSMHLQCQDSSGNGVACAVSAVATLTDGSKLIKATSLPVGGTTIIYMPGSAVIEWTAHTSGGLIGYAVSGVEDTVIQIEAPKTSNHVRCEMADGTAIACDLTLETTDRTLSRLLPADGALIQTGYEGSVLNWFASTYKVIDGDVYRLQGQATSGVAEDVLLVLDQSELLVGENVIQLSCHIDYDQDWGWWLDPAPQEGDYASCEVSVEAWGWNDMDENFYESLSLTLPLGETVTLPLPVLPVPPSNYSLSIEARTSDWVLGEWWSPATEAPISELQDEIELWLRPMVWAVAEVAER